MARDRSERAAASFRRPISGGGVSIRVEGIGQIKAAFDAVENELVRREGMMQALVRAGRIIRDIARDEAPELTGRLAREISVRRGRKSSTTSRVLVFARAPYARLVEFGTAPHTLRAKNSDVLVALGKFLGAEVEHPGAIANPFMRRALDKGAADAIAEAARTVDQSIEKAVEKIDRQASRARRRAFPRAA